MWILSQIYALLVPVLSLFYLFAGTGIAAYDFLCPNLHLLSLHTGLSEAVIGATFIAFGNASGDIFSSFVAFRHGNPSLAIGSIVGAALFIICVVIGALAFAQPNVIDSKFFVRDACFLVISISLVVFIISDGKITIHESLGLVGLYAVYATVLIKSESFFKLEPEFSHSNYLHLHPDLDDGPLRPSFVGAIEHFNDAISPSHSHHNHNHNDFENETIDSNYSDSSSLAQSPLSSPLADSVEFNRGLQIPKLELPHLGDDIPTSPLGKNSPALSIYSRISADEDRQTTVLEHVLPAYYEWNEFSPWLKAFNVIMWPMLASLQFSIPIPQTREGTSPRNLITLYAITAPLALYLLIFPHDWQISLVTCLVSLALVVSSRMLQVSVLVPAFAGFVLSIVWILTLTTHMVVIVKYIGEILNISKAVLGLTVVAIGNSLGDLVSNISIARSDHATMALSACFGSPLLLILIGIGGSSLIVMLLDNKTHIDIPKSTSVITSCVLLLVTLLTLAVVLPLNNWKMTRLTGAFCISVWVLNTVLNLTIYS